MSQKIINYKNIKQNSYLIDENGNIYSLLSNKRLKASPDKDGYLRIALLCENKTRKEYRIATLVAIHYIGEPPINMSDITVDHIDGDRTNNYYKNLQWLNRGLNSSKRQNKGIGSNNHEAKLTEKDVIEIANLINEGELTLTEIGKKYRVSKYTVSNIKRKKNWAYLTKNYIFTIKHQKNKQESLKQKDEIINNLIAGVSPVYLIKIGYPSTVVYRYNKKYGIPERISI